MLGHIPFTTQKNMFSPAGSFKYERLVRSSLASRIGGFDSGGKFGLFSSSISLSVVVIVFVWECYM